MLSVLDNRWQRTKFKICISIKCCLIMTETWNSLKKPHRTVQRSVPKYVWKRTPGYCIDYSEEENNDVCKSEIYQKKMYIYTEEYWLDVETLVTISMNWFHQHSKQIPNETGNQSWKKEPTQMMNSMNGNSGWKKYQLWFQEIGKDI